MSPSAPALPHPASVPAADARGRDEYDEREVALHTAELRKTYGSGRTAVEAVRGISCVFGRGTFTAIMGPSGSGKSTLMHCLAGLDTVTSGRVVLGGIDISGLGDRELTTVRRDRIGFVFQAFNLLPTLTARQNILLPHELAGTRPEPQHLADVTAALGLTDRLDHRPSQLSGGQQQRVAIARALIRRPEVVFADEPTGALDSTTGRQLLEHLRSASRDGGQTIVMVTHDPVAASYADRVLLLADGLLAGELWHPSVETVAAATAGLGA